MVALSQREVLPITVTVSCPSGCLAVRLLPSNCLIPEIIRFHFSFPLHICILYDWLCSNDTNLFHCLHFICIEIRVFYYQCRPKFVLVHILLLSIFDLKNISVGALLFLSHASEIGLNL